MNKKQPKQIRAIFKKIAKKFPKENITAWGEGKGFLYPTIFNITTEGVTDTTEEVTEWRNCKDMLLTEPSKQKMVSDKKNLVFTANHVFISAKKTLFFRVMAIFLFVSGVFFLPIATDDPGFFLLVIPSLLLWFYITFLMQRNIKAVPLQHTSILDNKLFVAPKMFLEIDSKLATSVSDIIKSKTDEALIQEFVQQFLTPPIVDREEESRQHSEEKAPSLYNKDQHRKKRTQQLSWTMEAKRKMSWSSLIIASIIIVIFSLLGNKWLDGHFMLTEIFTIIMFIFIFFLVFLVFLTRFNNKIWPAIFLTVIFLGSFVGLFWVFDLIKAG